MSEQDTARRPEVAGLLALLGTDVARFESTVYHLTSQMTVDDAAAGISRYQGGSWQLLAITHEEAPGYWWRLESESRFRFSNPGNGREATVDVELLSLAVNLPSPAEAARQITQLLEQFFAQDGRAKALPLERGITSRPSFVVDAIPVLSTAHVTQKTMERLQAGPIENVFGTVAVYPEGAFLSLATDNIPEDLPPDLVALCGWVREHRFGWARLDADGDIVPGLPVHDW